MSSSNRSAFSLTESQRHALATIHPLNLEVFLELPADAVPIPLLSPGELLDRHYETLISNNPGSESAITQCFKANLEACKAFSSGNAAIVISSLEKVIKIRRLVFEPSDPEFLDALRLLLVTLNDFSIDLIRSEQYAQAYHMLETMRSYAEKFLSGVERDMFRCIHSQNVAVYFIRKKQYAAAQRSLHKSLHLFSILGLEAWLFLGSVRMSAILLEMGKHEDVKALLMDCIAMMDAIERSMAAPSGTNNGSGSNSMEGSASAHSSHEFTSSSPTTSSTTGTPSALSSSTGAFPIFAKVLNMPHQLRWVSEIVRTLDLFTASRVAAYHNLAVWELNQRRFADAVVHVRQAKDLGRSYLGTGHRWMRIMDKTDHTASQMLFDAEAYRKISGYGDVGRAQSSNRLLSSANLSTLHPGKTAADGHGFLGKSNAQRVDMSLADELEQIGFLSAENDATSKARLSKSPYVSKSTVPLLHSVPSLSPQPPLIQTMRSLSSSLIQSRSPRAGRSGSSSHRAVTAREDAKTRLVSYVGRVRNLTDTMEMVEEGKLLKKTEPQNNRKMQANMPRQAAPTPHRPLLKPSTSAKTTPRSQSTSVKRASVVMQRQPEQQNVIPKSAPHGKSNKKDGSNHRSLATVVRKSAPIAASRRSKSVPKSIHVSSSSSITIPKSAPVYDESSGYEDDEFEQIMEDASSGFSSISVSSETPQQKVLKEVSTETLSFEELVLEHMKLLRYIGDSDGATGKGHPFDSLQVSPEPEPVSFRTSSDAPASNLQAENVDRAVRRSVRSAGTLAETGSVPLSSLEAQRVEDAFLDSLSAQSSPERLSYSMDRLRPSVQPNLHGDSFDDKSQRSGGQQPLPLSGGNMVVAVEGAFVSNVQSPRPSSRQRPKNSRMVVLDTPSPASFDDRRSDIFDLSSPSHLDSNDDMNYEEFST
eukprot:ANDGO_05574.mRNA.1 hypothetical protein